MNWSTPEWIVAQVLKRWKRGDILKSKVTGEALFPVELRLKGPTAGEIANRFGDVQDWVQALLDKEKPKKGFGFQLRFERRRNKIQGVNELPVAAIIPTELDALRLIRKESEVRRFEQLVKITLTQFSMLREWLAHRPLRVLKYADEWERVLAVLAWFADNPRPRLYLRQLDISGVDTKFVEAHRGLLAELLDLVLPDTAINFAASGAKGFCERYGLRVEMPQVRFRILDSKLFIRGISDLALPIDQFSALQLPVCTVFVTENRTNGLVFPACPGSIVIFGLGYGIECLAEILWLHNVSIYYWGDIDTHGFGILNRLRAHIPHVKSFLMDRKTLETHRLFWGKEPKDKRYLGEPSYLTSEEHNLFDDLRQDQLGERVRLEQEKIGYRWVEKDVNEVMHSSG